MKAIQSKSKQNQRQSAASIYGGKPNKANKKQSRNKIKVNPEILRRDHNLIKKNQSKIKDNQELLRSDHSHIKQIKAKSKTISSS